MKRIYTILQIATVMFSAVFILNACTKETSATGRIKEESFPVYSTDNNQSIGSISISQQSNGEAKVVVDLNESITRDMDPDKPMFTGSINGETKVVAYLNEINDANGRSETSPVKSTNQGLHYSYDALMFTRVLKLVVTDENNRIIAESQIR